MDQECKLYNPEECELHKAVGGATAALYHGRRFAEGANMIERGFARACIGSAATDEGLR
jgi:hypothetical protein